MPFDAAVYDSKHLGRVRQFATANTIQLLVMNIQAFQKDVEEDGDPTKANIINRAQDRMSGRRPIEFIQATRPVVIIDEPQNMESEAAAAAIDRLEPVLHAALLGDAQAAVQPRRIGSARSTRTT